MAMNKWLLLCLAVSTSTLQCAECAESAEAKSNQPQSSTTVRTNPPPDRAAVRTNPTPVKATNVDESVFAARSLDPELLRRLATSPNRDVRCAVASNPRTPHDVLLNISRNIKPFSSLFDLNDDRDIFFALTKNPILPADCQSGQKRTHVLRL